MYDLSLNASVNKTVKLYCINMGFLDPCLCGLIVRDVYA